MEINREIYSPSPKYAEFENVFKDCLQNANDDIDKAPALMSLVLCNVAKKNWKNAENYLDQYLKLRKACDKTHFCLAYIYYNNNQIERANNYVQKSLEINPSYPHSLALKKEIDTHLSKAI